MFFSEFSLSVLGRVFWGVFAVESLCREGKFWEKQTSTRTGEKQMKGSGKNRRMAGKEVRGKFGLLIDTVTNAE